ncbi:MAG: AAA family ATPase [Bryobacteraceae bacterium]|jgi:general secretion pathway protein A
MYTEFYGLAKKPFNMTPDPAFLFLTAQHREALAGLSYAILERKGFLVLSGMAGSGKTTLLAWILERLPCDRVQSSVVLNPLLTREEFLELAMLDFGLTDIPSSKAQRLWMLQKFLLQAKKEGRVSVLIVDEAHKLSVELMEEIRLLGNLEYGDEKLIQILLIGQSELDDLMNRPELFQLKQRVSVRLAIGPLSVDSVEKYIQHRWMIAGGSAPPFDAEAIASIRTCSKGIPRLINSLCDNALTLAFTDQAKSVGAAHVEMAARDLLLMEKPASPSGAAIAVAAPSAAAPKPLLAPPSNGAPRPVQPHVMKTIERYAPPARKKSVFQVVAGKFGWGSNGKGPAS